MVHERFGDRVVHGAFIRLALERPDPDRLGYPVVRFLRGFELDPHHPESALMRILERSEQPLGRLVARKPEDVNGGGLPSVAKPCDLLLAVEQQQTR